MVTRETIDTYLAKVKVGTGIFFVKAKKLDIIASFEIRADRLGFYYAPRGASHQQSVHFHKPIEGEILILEEHEIELVKVLYEEKESLQE